MPSWTAVGTGPAWARVVKRLGSVAVAVVAKAKSWFWSKIVEPEVLR